MAANNIIVSPVETWEDTRKRLIADYSPLLMSGAQDEYILLPIKTLDFNVKDDLGISFGNAVARFGDEPGRFAGLLIEAVRAGYEVTLCFKWDKVDEPMFVLLADRKTPVAVVAPGTVHDESAFEKLSDEDLLPSSIDNALLKTGLSFVKGAIEPTLHAAMVDWKDALCEAQGCDKESLLIDFLIRHADQECLQEVPAVQVYSLCFGLDEDDIERCRSVAMEKLEEFYRTLYEHGEWHEMYDVDSSLAFAKKDIDNILSNENLLIGKLDYRLENIGNVYHEIQTDDIVNVWRWAEKEGAYAPYVGEYLTEWAKERAQYYNLSEKALLGKYQQAGGDLKAEPVKPLVPDGMKPNLVKKFEVK